MRPKICKEYFRGVKFVSMSKKSFARGMQCLFLYCALISCFGYSCTLFSTNSNVSIKYVVLIFLRSNNDGYSMTIIHKATPKNFNDEEM